MLPDIWTVEEVAKYLKVKQEEIMELVKKNKIPHFLVGLHARFRSDEVIRWTEGNQNFRGSQKPIPAEYRSGHNKWVMSVDQKTLFIILNRSHTAITYSLIPLSGEVRWFFPGYKEDFTLETDAGDIITRVTSDYSGVKIGDPNRGKYIQGGLAEWFRMHKDDIDSRKYCLRITQVEKDRRYRLDLVPLEQTQVL